MISRFFDFEVTPHWWMCVFGDLPDNFDDVNEQLKDKFIVVNSDMENCRDELLKLMRDDRYCLTGYNVKGYDLVIANGIYQGFTPEQIYILSNLIINPGCAYDSREHIKMQPFARKKLNNLNYQDLMDDSTGSLKDKEMVLGLNILESSVPFDKEDLTDDDKYDMTYYCKQDVYASMRFYTEIVHPYTLTKLAMGKAFNIPEKVCRSSTNAKLVAIALGAKRTTFADADKIEIELPKKIRDYCYDNIPYKLLEKLLTSAESFTTYLFDNDVSYGNGGIHSVYKPCVYVESNDEWLLMNIDATSYYPSMLIQFDCLSRAVQNKEIFINIFKERIRIKHKEHKTEEDESAQKAYKLVLNTTFGASGNKFIDLYDPHLCTRTCRLGQIFLTALAHKLYKTIPYIKIIQTNTDGILIYVKKIYYDKVKQLMQEWTDVSGINMEEDQVDKIWQRDVNNYLLVMRDGKVKCKGGWLNTDFHRPGYVTVGSRSAFVSAKAAKEWFLNGTNVVDTILKDRDIGDFVMSCTKGPSYSYVVQKMSDGSENRLFKCNRVIATKDRKVGKIYKIKRYKGNLSYTQMASIPDYCKLINEDLTTYDFNEVKKEIDYIYYVQRAIELINLPWQALRSGILSDTSEFEYKI